MEAGPGQFVIQITRQHWIKEEFAATDRCSHGGIRLRVGDFEITDGTQDYGISQSALALLRTLEQDRVRGDTRTEAMILHGCSTILMMTCGIGVDWTTHHEGGRVRISGVVRFDGPGRTKAVEFPDATVELSFQDYSAQVLPFAVEARRFFEGVKKTADDDFDRQQYIDFWNEYDGFLARFGGGRREPLGIEG